MDYDQVEIVDHMLTLRGVSEGLLIELMALWKLRYVEVHHFLVVHCS